MERMTVAEKLAQLGCEWVTALTTEKGVDAGHVLEVIPNGIGQVTRIGGATGLEPRERARVMNAIQKAVVDNTRLGIPVMVHEEAVAGYSARGAAQFPQALTLASTWNQSLVEDVAGVVRDQMMAVGARLALAPVLDVARDPRWGRVEETYGEDPVLVAGIGVRADRALWAPACNLPSHRGPGTDLRLRAGRR